MAAAYSLTAVATERYWCLVCYAAVITIISTTFFSMPTTEEEGREGGRLHDGLASVSVRYYSRGHLLFSFFSFQLLFFR